MSVAIQLDFFDFFWGSTKGGGGYHKMQKFRFGQKIDYSQVWADPKPSSEHLAAPC